MKPADSTTVAESANLVEPPVPSGSIDQMLAHTARDLAALPLPDAEGVRGVRHFEFREFSDSRPRASASEQQDPELELKIELGHTQISRDDLPELRSGSVVSLDRLVNEPADIVVDGRIVARGEVMVLDERFCIRITELFGFEELRASA
jgi:flagellar motor switch protein FliN